jgi:regulator of protease activity HflC (stomatin/prohibitin superfamily)
MLGMRYHKSSPTTYVLHYRGGKLAAEGPGLSFLYWTPVSTIVQVPLESVDLPFVFKEITSDFQEVALQGQLSYRVRDPRRLAGLLDYSIAGDGSYASDDPSVPGQRLVQAAQGRARSMIEGLTLREALVSSDAIADGLRRSLPTDPQAAMLGLEVLDVSLASVRPTPDMAKALEARAREELKRQADDAVYERRNAAVEAERRIKESELATELAVEEKRAGLVESRAANDKKAADSRAYALEVVLKPLRDLDWRILLAAVTGKLDNGLMIASAFRDLAQNAEKIGELNISPDLLARLMKGEGGT